MVLVAIAGPRAGAALPLTDGLALGGADVGPEDAPPCCRISAANGWFVLHALDRQTAVFVNGLPVTTRTLEPRDELRIGDSLFIVRLEDDAAQAPAPLERCPIRFEPGSGASVVLELRFEEMLLQLESPGTAREARDLANLLRIGAALSSIHGLAALDGALAGLVLDIVPVERMAILEPDGGTGGASKEPTAWSARGAAAVEALRIDPAMVARVATDRAAVVLGAPDADRGRQAVVVPMVAYGRTAGTIWGDAPLGVALDAGHLRLLLVVGALAAVTREQAREAERLHEANELLQAEINLEHNMVGRSRPMRALFDRIARVAKTDATILLRGESGTGKELVARAVHRNSARAERPFIAINCAALTESLLESELFGHEKGAFTGAIGLKKGKLELADGGTLFLDEIGELPLGLQAKLLRALQEREFERVGGTRPVRVDFRLIAATNRDLEAAVKASAFRQDLFYRLNVVSLALPALRDRKEDLPLLAEYFIRKHAPRCGRRVGSVAREALARLERHAWPGNVRELENVIEQALVLGAGARIVAADLPSGLGETGASIAGPDGMDYHTALARARRELIVRAFERAGRSHTAAARLLGVHPNYLHRLIKNLDLKSAIGKD
jgi:Nif-specific regulatory protein